MSDFVRTAAVIFLTSAPLSALAPFDSLTEPRIRLRRAVFVSAAAFALLAATVLMADPFLELIDVSPENFQLAAALIVLPHAFRLIVRPISTASAGDRADFDWLVPLTVPLLVSPASVAASLSYASRFGWDIAAGAAALVFALTAAILASTARFDGLGRSPLISLTNRFSGALLIALAVELAVDGIRSV